MGVIGRAASLAAVAGGYGTRMAGAAIADAFGADRDQAFAKATGRSVTALADALAKARGPALKFGQTLALFAGTLDDDTAQQLTALNRLFENAQPRPLAELGGTLAKLPPKVELDPEAVNAASLGQVHKALWVDGSPVAVKVQYPDARRMVRSDMLQLRTLAPLIGRILPTLDVPALVNEHARRLEQELDYQHEAAWQQRFAKAWQDHGISIPTVRFATGNLLVTDWVDGTGWSELENQPGTRRNTAGRQLARFCLWSPRLVGAVHADMHPGNFRLLDDGRLAVLDFGSVADNAGRFTRLFATTWQLAAQNRPDELLTAWKNAGLVSQQCTSQQLWNLLDVDTRLWERDEFTFSREWLQQRAPRLDNPGHVLDETRKLRFPPDYLLEHRAVMGMLALLCSIDATVDFRTVLDQVGDSPEWQDGT